jgi:hypothetical protein
VNIKWVPENTSWESQKSLKSQGWR